MRLVPYNPAMKEMWDCAVRASRNGTFLFRRDYMDYHCDRFEDHSLCFFDDHNKWVACLPACCLHNEKVVTSHGGLTYGGFILSPHATCEDVLAMFNLSVSHYRAHGFERFLYKPIPYIYNSYPSEEDLYALFQQGALLISCAVSSTVDLCNPLPLSQLRTRKQRKAQKAQLKVCSYELVPVSEREAALCEFWRILTDVLSVYHQTKPVHTFNEIKRLQALFPENIRLYTTLSGSPDHIVAGCVVYETTHVAHVQYIAANAEGRSLGALDLLFSVLRQSYAQRLRYLDFGISTEDQGRRLNAGLLFQKEGFGGRAVCYDCYQILL